MFREKIFLKVHFQKRVGNSSTKSDFDFGRRSCRLCAAEASFVHKQPQDFLGIQRLYFP